MTFSGKKGNTPCNLRKKPLVESVCQGSKSVPFLGPKIWVMMLEDWKDNDILNTFKNNVKKWKAENCPWRLCKICINNIDFVWEGKKASLEYSSTLFGIMTVVYQAAGDFLQWATNATNNERIMQQVTSDFLQRVTSATSNKQILQRVTSDFITSKEQWVNFSK